MHHVLENKKELERDSMVGQRGVPGRAVTTWSLPLLRAKWVELVARRLMV